MKLKGKKIAFALTGAFSQFENTIVEIENIVLKQAEVIPIMSNNAYKIDTKYGKASDFIQKIENITNKKIIHTISKAEQIGKKIDVDTMIIAPATRKYYCENCKQHSRYICELSYKMCFA